MNAKTTKSPRRFARPPLSTEKDPSPTSEKSADAGLAPVKPLEATAPASPRPESKIARITGLLSSAGGASLEELVTATGWQSHTTRAALTGLRKKGHAITKTKVDDVTRYSIAASQS